MASGVQSNRPLLDSSSEPRRPSGSRLGDDSSSQHALGYAFSKECTRKYGRAMSQKRQSSLGTVKEGEAMVAGSIDIESKVQRLSSTPSEASTGGGVAYSVGSGSGGGMTGGSMDQTTSESGASGTGNSSGDDMASGSQQPLIPISSHKRSTNSQ